MKTVNKGYVFLIIIFSIVAWPGEMWAANGGTETVEIQTNAICESCQERIEAALYEVPGVKSASLDLETKVVTIKFKTSKTSAEDLKQVIVDTGYDADDIKANTQARENLPHCCVYGH